MLKIRTDDHRMSTPDNTKETETGIRAAHENGHFYSPIVADQLRSRRKTATIRLGDKSGKYKKGMVVQILVGQRYGPREKIFDAVIDKVEVKRLMELSPREIEHDNPEIRRPEDMASFLGHLYNRDVTEEDVVTLIRFSEILAR